MAGRNQRRRRREQQAAARAEYQLIDDIAWSVDTPVWNEAAAAFLGRPLHDAVLLNGTTTGHHAEWSVVDETKPWQERSAAGPVFDATAAELNPPYTSDIHWRWRSWGYRRPELSAIAASAPIPPSGLHDKTTQLPIITDLAAALQEPTAPYRVIQEGHRR